LGTEEQTNTKTSVEELAKQIEQAVNNGLKPGELTVEMEWKEPTWLKQRCSALQSGLNEIWPGLMRQSKTCLRVQMQPAISEEDLRNKLQVVAWANDIREKKPLASGAFKVFHIDLPKGSLTDNTLSGLNDELQQALSHQIMGTPTIVEVKSVPSVGGKGLLLELFFIGLDVFTDCLQIYHMYMDEFYIMGGTLLSVFVSSLTAQILSKELCNLPGEVCASLRKGVKTDGYLRIGDQEKGFEGFMSLAISCYVLYWQVDATSCITSFISIILSGRGVATYLFQTVFLEHAADFL